MEHRFIKEVADLYGIEEALIFKYISFNVIKNEQSNKFFDKDKYWLCTTTKYLKENVFTYMSERQITYALNNLKKENLILAEINGKTKTTWYTLTSKAIDLLKKVNDKIVNQSKSDLQNCQSLGVVNDKIVNHSYIIYTNKKYILNNKIKRYFKLESVNACTHARASPPTLEDIENFIKERKSPVNAKRFYDYYSANNWKDKNNQSILSNWKQRLISWERDEPQSKIKKVEFTESENKFYGERNGII